MNQEKKLILSLFFFLSAISCASASPWIEDFKAAKKEATQSGKDMLVLFTGLDWCGPCQMMHQEVFQQPTFLEQAQQNFVLVFLDYPQLSPQNEKIRKQNEELASLYQIQGFPTIILMKADGKPYGVMTGYDQSGVKGFFEKVESLQEKKKHLTELEKAIETSSTEDEREKKLEDFFTLVDELKFSSHYREYFDHIFQEYPHTVNFKKHYSIIKEYENFLATWTSKDSDLEQAIKILYDLNEKASAWPNLQQKILFTLSRLFSNMINNQEKAKETFQKAKALVPYSEEAKMAENWFGN